MTPKRYQRLSNLYNAALEVEPESWGFSTACAARIKSYAARSNLCLVLIYGWTITLPRAIGAMWQLSSVGCAGVFDPTDDGTIGVADSAVIKIGSRSRGYAPPYLSVITNCSQSPWLLNRRG